MALRVERDPTDTSWMADVLDALPAAIYVTDADGRLTHFNQAAVALAGRVPEPGVDRWCISWKLYRPDGTPLPLDECPMAIALQEGRPVRNAEVLVEQPDGARFHVAPFPTPMLDAAGRVVGGINMLVDVTDRRRTEVTVQSLLGISERLNSALDLETLLDVLVQEAIQLVGAESGVAGLCTPDGMVAKSISSAARSCRWTTAGRRCTGCPAGSSCTRCPT